LHCSRCPSLDDFKSITFDSSGDPKTGIRAILHRKGDPEWKIYCLDSIASGKTFTLTKFNAKCWGDNTFVDLALADLPVIDQIGLMLPMITNQVTVDDFCLKEVRFGR
jgi:hypothetical protein